MADLTPHQQKIVKRYYDNLGGLKLQRLKELVSDLYLAEGKKRQRVWDQIAAAMEKLNIPAARIDHLRRQDNPAVLAEVVADLEKNK